jgi:hypothetical protein
MKDFHRDRDFRRRLEEACEGLIYVSETDALVEPFFSAEIEESTARELAPFVDPSKRGHVEELKFDRFFERLTRSREWQGAKEKKRAKKFSNLRELLEENLTDLKVFRFGKIRIDIFVVGVNRENKRAGVRTQVVET